MCTVGPRIHELAKSTLPAGLADPQGVYPFYCSSPDVKRIDRVLADMPAVLMGTGGIASVHYASGPFAYSTDTWAFTSRDAQTDLRFLYRQFERLLPRIDFLGFGGSGLRHLNKGFIRQMVLPSPSPDVQAKVAQVLDTLDAAIAQTEAIVAKLKAVKQGLLHDLLTRGIDANGELRPPHSEAPRLYKQSELGWIPKEWEVRPLGELAEVSRGKFTHRPRNDPRYLGGRHPFIQTGDVAAAGGDYVSEYSQTLSDLGISVSQEFPAGTIAITIAANIADTAILSIPMCFPDSVVGAVVHEPHNIRFVELSIRKAKRVLDARAPQSAQKNINLQDLRPLLLAVPHESEQGSIAARYEALQARLEAEVQSASKQHSFKSGLMDDLLTGNVRVTGLIE